MDEQRLIKQAQQGDKEAFDLLVERHDALLQSLTAWYVGARDGPDAAQEIWLAVFRKLWQLEEADRFVPWLRKLTFYQCMNYRKARARRQHEIYLDTEAWLRVAEFLADEDGSVERLLDRRLLRSTISQELDTLPGEFGLLLRLRYLQEQSLAEIAALTLLPISTIKWRLHEGRRILKARLASILKTGKGTHRS